MRRATISFVMAVWTDFHEIRFVLVFFENLSRKFKFDYNPTRITGTLHADICKFMIIFSLSLLRTEIFKTKVLENQNTHVQYFFSENCAIYEIMWKNMVQPDRPQMKLCGTSVFLHAK